MAMATSSWLLEKREPRELDLKTASRYDLVAFVQTITPQPCDHYAIAAVLETYGLRDVDVQQYFGRTTIFDLASELYDEYRAQAQRDLLVDDITRKMEEQRPRTTLFQKMHTASLFYLRGLFFTAPWMIQVLCLAFFGYGFGVAAAFSPAQAMGAVCGMVGSFIVTGGIVQTIGRMASFYLGQQNYVLTHQLYVKAISIGVLVSVVIGLIGYGVSLLILGTSQEFAAASAAYFILFSILSLYLSLFYILHQYKGLIAVTIAGALVMVLMMELTTLGIYAAHAGGVCMSGICAAWFIRGYLHREHRQRTILQQVPVLPRFPVLFYNMLPYCVAGTLYFFFLFSDRIIHWTAPDLAQPVVSVAGIGMIIHPVYEYGIIWAFIVFILVTPLFEYISARFNMLIKPLQERFSAAQYQVHNKFFLQEYLRYCAVLVLFIAGSMWLVYDAAMYLERYDATGILRAVVTVRLQESELIFWWAAAGYGFLAWALMNNLLLFSLGHPWLVVRGLLAGILINIATGLLFSRTMTADLSIMGMTIGAGTIMMVTMWYVVRTLRNMDYWYYAAY